MLINKQFSGKILSDDTKISDCNIDSKKFVVVMVSKAAGAASTSSATNVAGTSSSTSIVTKPSPSISTSQKPAEK